MTRRSSSVLKGLAILAEAVADLEPLMVRRLKSSDSLSTALRQDFTALGLTDGSMLLAQALVADCVSQEFAESKVPLEVSPDCTVCPRLDRLLRWLAKVGEDLAPWRERLASAARQLATPGADALLTFYEDLLASSNRGLRRACGVYYTPPALSEWIVRQALHHLGQQCSDAVSMLRVIDPAAGTGSFLVEILQGMQWEPVAGTSRRGLTVTGCELLPAACVIMRHRLFQAVRNSHAASPGLQLRLYWANSLSDEAPAWRSDIYDIIVGNPPFGMLAHPLADWLKPAVASLHEGLIHERNRQPLADACVRFLALACQLKRSPQAVLGMVVNRTSFDGRLYGGLRRIVRQAFPDLTLLDLGGDTRSDPSVSCDQNVFAMTQGVGVILAGGGESRLRYVRLNGSRREKLARLSECVRPEAFPWQPVHAVTPESAWLPESVTPSSTIEAEYRQFPSLVDLMPFRSPGVKTSCDAVAFGWTRNELEMQVRAAGWDWDAARSVPAVYRPGDVRWLYYDPPRLGRPRPELARHVLRNNTPSLITTRQFVGREFTHVAVCRGLACHGVFYLGNRGQDYQFPLSVCTPQGVVPNLNRNRLPDGLHSPDRFLHYASAILLSPQYGERYQPFLAQDFPRIPLASNPETLRQLCFTGEIWVKAQLWLHAGDSPPPGVESAADAVRIWQHAIGEPVARDAPRVHEGAIQLNERTGLVAVPESIWNRRMGGYQPCRTFWKARRGRTITPQDLDQFSRLTAVLELTGRLQDQLREIW